MNIPQLRMDSTMGKIGLRIKKPIQHIEQPRADLHIEQPRPSLSIKTTRGKLTIDQSKAWEDMNLYTPLKSTKVYASESREEWYKGIARMAQEGDMLMEVHKSNNAIATISENNAWPAEKQFNVGWIPSVFAVKTHYQPAKLDIEINRNEPIIKAKTNKPIHEYTPGKVNGFMRQWPDLKIWVEGENK